MNENLQNIIKEYKKLNATKYTSLVELQDNAFKIQNLSNLMNSYFKEQVNEVLDSSNFLIHFNEITQKMSLEQFPSEDKLMANIKKKYYSPQDLVLLLDSELNDDQSIIALLMCSQMDNFLKLNTYFTTNSKFI